MSKSIEATIECPFYISEDENYILCEGIIKNTVQKNIFGSDKAKKEYEKSVCSVNSGKKCWHYRNVHRLYDLGEK